jgi:uncharacterized protein YacL
MTDIDVEIKRKVEDFANKYCELNRTLNIIKVLIGLLLALLIGDVVMFFLHLKFTGFWVLYFTISIMMILLSFTMALAIYQGQKDKIKVLKLLYNIKR